jgi:hypothetical protein
MWIQRIWIQRIWIRIRNTVKNTNNFLLLPESSGRDRLRFFSDENPNLFVHCCDFSPRAVEFVRYSSTDKFCTSWSTVHDIFTNLCLDFTRQKKIITGTY